LVVELDNRPLPSLHRRIAVLALLSATLGLAPLRAQDVAEAARQERERKVAQQNAPHHVYTDDDLKRNKILTLEDASRVIAHKEIPTAPEKKETAPQLAEQAKETKPQVTEQNQNTESLGEVARRYRQEKTARQAEQAAKSESPSRYPLDFPAASLAAPKPMVAPSTGSLRSDELKSTPRTIVPTPRTYAPVPRNNFPSRLSPFVPRDAVVPRSPAANVPLAVLAGSVHREKVLPGDSWWKLAGRYLGKGSRWAELLRVNPGLSQDPHKLIAGTLVFVPENVRPKKAPPGAQILVRKGDTLWSLAREHLGCGQSWPQLAAANPEITNFTKLQIGSKLNLPDKAAPVCLDTQQQFVRSGHLQVANSH
jgi:nucleoid-associated protein YgaU